MALREVRKTKSRCSSKHIGILWYNNEPNCLMQLGLRMMTFVLSRIVAIVVLYHTIVCNNIHFRLRPISPFVHADIYVHWRTLHNTIHVRFMHVDLSLSVHAAICF